MIPEKARETLELALKKTGEVLLSYYGREVEARVKESISSVVTEADLAAEKEIIGILTKVPESFNIISEETGILNNGSEYTWIVDPLEWTSNFAAGLPWFGVIIALLHEETPVLGGMYLPLANDLYMAELGKGAFKNGEAVRISTSENLEEQLVAYSFDFCYLADGRLGAAVNQSTKIWDIAAAWLLIKEAGGKVSDIHGGEIMFRVSEDAINLNYTIVASGSSLHDGLISTIESK